MIATIYRPHKLEAADDTSMYEKIKSVNIRDLDYPNVDWTLMNKDN